MCLNNLSNKYNHFMTYHQKKIKTFEQFFQMILFILLRKIVLINWDCWKLLDFNLFIVVLILFCIRGFIHFSVGIIRRMTPWSAVNYFYFVTIKKSSFISTRSVRLTFWFPLSGSVLFHLNKILNKVYLELMSIELMSIYIIYLLLMLLQNSLAMKNYAYSCNL